MVNNLYIIMPCFNEEANIEEVISDWYPFIEKIGRGSKLVVIDDGSTDKTFSILKNLQRKLTALEVIHKKNSGHGPTCLLGYKYAANKDVNFIFQTDSDGQTSANEFWHFWKLRNKYDFIVGSREKRQDGFSRIFISKVLRIFLFLKLNVWVKDANTPFRLMRTSVLKKYLRSIPNDFFLINALLSALFVIKKENYKWLPISFGKRSKGKNSINLGKVLRIWFVANKEINKLS